jgi:hypothetical protein
MSMDPSNRTPPEIVSVYGMLAEFDSAEALTAAVRAAREDGYTRMDAYSPLPVAGLGEALGLRETRLPFIVLVGGILGGLGGYILQWWTMAVAYPLNVGGRPLHSWPAFIPVTFELTILGATLAAVLGMLALNRLPQPYHPLFNAPEFSLATQNRFFLCIESADPRFEVARVSDRLTSLGAMRVTVVEY